MRLDQKIKEVIIENTKRTLPYIFSASLLIPSLNINSSERESASGSSWDYKINISEEFMEDVSYPVSLLLKNLSHNCIRNLDGIALLTSLEQSQVFEYNKLYDSIRINNDLEEITKSNINEDTVFIINKTFQKAGIYTKSGLEYNLIKSMDCSTALRYGKKQFNGDGKTPEGIFRIYDIKPSHNHLYKNGLWYGPYKIGFDAEHPSILIHGNGTDTLKIKDWANNPRYIQPEPLGIYDNNIAYGRSHGCIRLNNEELRYAVQERLLQKGLLVLIYENEQMTNILNKYYNNSYDDESLNKISQYLSIFYVRM